MVMVVDGRRVSYQGRVRRMMFLVTLWGAIALGTCERDLGKTGSGVGMSGRVIMLRDKNSGDLT
jgi:hypothetical protein